LAAIAAEVVEKGVRNVAILDYYLKHVSDERVEPGQNWPTPREHQVLSYHKKHRTTSPLYEKIRAKYPNW
jgi:hypothetical protein